VDYAGILLAGLAIGYGLSWALHRADAGRFPELFSPISSEERKAREDLTDAESVIGDLRVRLKHAEQECARAKRDAKEFADECNDLRAVQWGIRRLLDRCPEPEAVAVTGLEERAG